MGKRILHFAPEKCTQAAIEEKAVRYATADFLREGCDLKLDMSNMAEIKNGSFDIVIAFDVLEHVPDYHKALKEVRRILSSNGFGIFTVPQKDNLEETYEDKTIDTAELREKYYGAWNHLRIFGDNFPGILGEKGFKVTAVDESFFPEAVNKKHVLFPPRPSAHPLATNYRKVFFCERTA
jgi:SAM-dependent methyltransferase